MQIGDRVEVHTRFDGSWCDGFEVAELAPDGYRIRRVSDGALLPGHTSDADLRPAPEPAR
jgi:hypothetical protein